MSTDTSRVTRFEVIDHTTEGKDGHARIVVRYDVAVELALQDDGRTLKIFLTDAKGHKGK